jgi:hypothetical protein
VEHRMPTERTSRFAAVPGAMLDVIGDDGPSLAPTPPRSGRQT